MVKIDRRRMYSEKTLSEREKTELLKQYITLPEAVARINRRIPQGYHVSRDLFAHRVSRGTIPCIRIGKAYYFKPEIIDNLTFKPKKQFQQGSITPIQVTSVEELRPLEEKYGPLVDMQGFLAAMQEYTGHAYKIGAIKQRILRGTIVYVAYFGSKKRKHYMFPVNQMYAPDFFKVSKQQGEAEKQDEWDIRELNQMLDLA